MNSFKTVSNTKFSASPRGFMQWCKVLRPDTKFDPDGMFSVALYVPETDAAKMMADIDVAIDAEADKARTQKPDKEIAFAQKPYKRVELEGEVFYKFKFKQSAVVRPKGKPEYNVSIGVFDAKKNHWDKDTLIGNGSEGKVTYSIYPWNVASLGIGATLKLKGLQVLKLEPYENAAESLFEEEDGYSISKDEESPGEESTVGAGSQQDVPVN